MADNPEPLTTSQEIGAFIRRTDWARLAHKGGALVRFLRGEDQAVDRDQKDARIGAGKLRAAIDRLEQMAQQQRDKR